MAKLSPAQQTMLARLKAGEKISVHTGLTPFAFWNSGDRARLPTVLALVKAGSAKVTDEDWRGYTVVAG